MTPDSANYADSGKTDTLQQTSHPRYRKIYHRLISTQVNWRFSIYAMQGSILPVTIPPGHTPGDLQFFSYLAVYSPPPGTQKETIPDPRDSSSTTNTLFCVQNWFPYNSTTRRFDKNLNAFLEFTERRILQSIKKHGHYQEPRKRKLKKKSNRSGIRLASKEMFFTACFILNIAHAQKRSGEQIGDSIKKEFFLACFTRTPDLDLCLI